jgi:hypothetical protein
MRTLAMLSLYVAAVSKGEVIDRVAVAFDRSVITESAIYAQIRITAFLNEEPLSFDGAAKRKAADQLLEQALIRREMGLSRYVQPEDAEIPAMLDQFRKGNYPDPVRYREKLKAYGISEAQLGRALLQQAAILRFVELRFRPGIAIGDGEIELYYREQFVPNWEKQRRQAPPDLDEARDQIEETLAAERMDQALDEWLREARNQARVRYFEEAFR